MCSQVIIISSAAQQASWLEKRVTHVRAVGVEGDASAGLHEVRRHQLHRVVVVEDVVHHRHVVVVERSRLTDVGLARVTVAVGLTLALAAVVVALVVANTCRRRASSSERLREIRQLAIIKNKIIIIIIK